MSALYGYVGPTNNTAVISSSLYNQVVAMYGNNSKLRLTVPC